MKLMNEDSLKTQVLGAELNAQSKNVEAFCRYAEKPAATAKEAADRISR